MSSGSWSAGSLPSCCAERTLNLHKGQLDCAWAQRGEALRASVTSTPHRPMHRTAGETPDMVSVGARNWRNLASPRPAQPEVAAPRGATLHFGNDVVHIRVACPPGTSIIISQAATSVRLNPKIALKCGPGPAIFCPVTASHGSRSPPFNIVGIEHLAPKTDPTGMVSKSRENTLIAHVKACRIISDPTAVAAEPPVVLIPL